MMSGFPLMAGPAAAQDIRRDESEWHFAFSSQQSKGPMSSWLIQFPAFIMGVILFAAMAIAAFAGLAFRRWIERRRDERNETNEGYVVAGMLTLVGLLIGFTFSMAIDRYEARRMLVIDDANAIETLYLRAQLLDEPHRSRFSNLLVRYTDNHLRLAQVQGDEAQRLLGENDRLLADLWTATVPAFDTIRGIDFSSSFVDSVNQVIQVDAARRAARYAQIPAPVFGVMFLYAIATAFVLGGILTGPHGLTATILLVALFTLAFVLLVDINKPVTGAIRESQQPMEELRETMRRAPPALFDRLRPPPAAAERP